MEPVSVDLTDFPSEDRVCRRCGETSPMRFPGLCGGCAQALRARFAPDGAPRAEVSAEYVPKMNVTPNAVALKDD